MNGVNRRRHNRVEIKLDDDEYEKLLELKEKTKLSTVDLISRLINDAEVREVPPIDFWELAKQIRYYGNNLNQIVKRAHQFGVDNEAYQRNTDKVFQILDNLMDRMLQGK